MAIERVPALRITRSRPANNKAGRQLVTLDLVPGSKVGVLGVTGRFRFKMWCQNTTTGNTWAEVDGGLHNHMRAIPVEKLIPPTWPVRPKNYEYVVHDVRMEDGIHTPEGSGGESRLRA